VPAQPLAGARPRLLVALGDGGAHVSDQRFSPARSRIAPTDEQLPDGGAAQLVDEPRVAGELPGLELAGGGVEQRHPSASVGPQRHRPDVGCLPRIEDLVVEHRPRGDDPGHLALHDRRLAGLLHLIADGDLEAPLEQLRHVATRGVVRHAAHRDLVVALGARGERDLQDLCGLDRVLEEQLVEVAQPKKEHAVRVPGLRLQVLAHHRRERCGGCDLWHRSRASYRHGPTPLRPSRGTFNEC
jgi:hypothetical protein